MSTRRQDIDAAIADLSRLRSTDVAARPALAAIKLTQIMLDSVRQSELHNDLTTKRDAVNFALRRVANEPFSVDQARSMRGAGWDADLDQVRARHTPLRAYET